jgi:hypothetical protein
MEAEICFLDTKENLKIRYGNFGMVIFLSSDAVISPFGYSLQHICDDTRLTKKFSAF